MTQAIGQIVMAELMAKLNEPGTKAAIASGLSKRFAPQSINTHIQATISELSNQGLPQNTVAASRLASGVEAVSTKAGRGPAPAGLVGTAVVCERVLCDWHSSGQLRDQATKAAAAIDERLRLKGRLTKLVDRAAGPDHSTLHQPAAPQITDLVQQASEELHNYNSPESATESRTTSEPESTLSLQQTPSALTAPKPTPAPPSTPSTPSTEPAGGMSF